MQRSLLRASARGQHVEDEQDQTAQLAEEEQSPKCLLELDQLRFEIGRLRLESVQRTLAAPSCDDVQNQTLEFHV